MAGDKTLHVLVVDDTQLQLDYTQQVIRVKLRRDGIAVDGIVGVSSMSEALEVLETSSYDIIATDLHLEDPPTHDAREADGFKLMERIAQHPQWGATFRILYSSQTMRGDVPQFTDNGISVYHNYVWIHHSARNRRQQLESAVEDAVKVLDSPKVPASV